MNFLGKQLIAAPITVKEPEKKLVYIALFPPNSPRNKHDDGSSPDSDAITEAGIFNSPYFGNVKNDASKEHPFDIEDCWRYYVMSYSF